MIPQHVIDNIKEVLAVGTVIVGITAGYTSTQKDVHSLQEQVQANAQVDTLQSQELTDQSLINARVDERTRIMKEQLDRIERNTAK